MSAVDVNQVQVITTKATQRLKELQSQARSCFGEKAIALPLGKAARITIPFPKPFSQKPIVICTIETPDSESDVIHHVLERSATGFNIILEHVLPFGSVVDEASKEVCHITLMWHAFIAL